MSNLGGLGGALLLSNQISTYRLLDSYRRAREASSLALNDTAWRNHYNTLVNNYNRLLQDANRLADAQDRSIEAQAGHIAELQAENAELRARVEKLLLERDDARSHVKLLQSLDRELHPEAHQHLSGQD